MFCCLKWSFNHAHIILRIGLMTKSFKWEQLIAGLMHCTTFYAGYRSQTMKEEQLCPCLRSENSPLSWVRTKNKSDHFSSPTAPWLKRGGSISTSCESSLASHVLGETMTTCSHHWPGSYSLTSVPTTPLYSLVKWRPFRKKHAIQNIGRAKWLFLWLYIGLHE